jgi:hypothetical protein
LGNAGRDLVGKDIGGYHRIRHRRLKAFDIPTHADDEIPK